MGSTRRRRLVTAALAAVFVLLFALYLYSSADESTAPSTPTSTVAPAVPAR